MGNPAWTVKKVIPRKDYTLLITFEDGKSGVYDFRPDLSRSIFKKQYEVTSDLQSRGFGNTMV